MFQFASAQQTGSRIPPLRTIGFLLLFFTSKGFLTTKGRWEAFHGIHFTGEILLGLDDFLRKTQFQNWALRVAKVTVDVESEKSKKKGGAHIVKSAFKDGTLSFFCVKTQVYKICVQSDSGTE